MITIITITTAITIFINYSSHPHDGKISPCRLCSGRSLPRSTFLAVSSQPQSDPQSPKHDTLSNYALNNIWESLPFLMIHDHETFLIIMTVRKKYENNFEES